MGWGESASKRGGRCCVRWSSNWRVGNGRYDDVGGLKLVAVDCVCTFGCSLLFGVWKSLQLSDPERTSV